MENKTLALIKFVKKIIKFCNARIWYIIEKKKTFETGLNDLDENDSDKNTLKYNDLEYIKLKKNDSKVFSKNSFIIFFNSKCFLIVTMRVVRIEIIFNFINWNGFVHLINMIFKKHSKSTQKTLILLNLFLKSAYNILSFKIIV